MHVGDDVSIIEQLLTVAPNLFALVWIVWYFMRHQTRTMRHMSNCIDRNTQAVNRMADICNRCQIHNNES